MAPARDDERPGLDGDGAVPGGRAVVARLARERRGPPGDAGPRGRRVEAVDAVRGVGEVAPPHADAHLADGPLRVAVVGPREAPRVFVEPVVRERPPAAAV